METRIDLFGNTLSPNTVTGGSRITFSAPSSSSSSKSKKKTSSKSLYGGLSDYSGYNTVTTSGGSYSASGVRPYTVTKADISGLLKAYEDQAASARNTAQTTYDTTRNDLLTSLKRFQEQNAKDVDNQRRSYLSEQASLESAREQADRNSRISAAARGLGGSGLQQLAQLQNLLNQGQDISELAGENQSVMDKLASALQQKQEDTDTGIANALKTYNDTITNIDSTLANQKAQAIYENEQNYINALNQAKAAAAQYSYSSSPGTTTTSDSGTLVRTVLDQLNRDLKSVANSKKTYKTKSSKNSQAKKLVADAHSSIQSLLEAYGNTGLYNTYKNDVNNALKSYGLTTYYK